MKRKAITEEFAYEEEIRTVIAGYCELSPYDSSNYFYTEFKKGWNRVYRDLKKHNASNSRTSSMLILSAAREERDELYKRSSEYLNRIDNFAEDFITLMERLKPRIREEEKYLFSNLIGLWKKYKDGQHFAFCIEFTGLVCEIINPKSQNAGDKENILFIINESLATLKNQIQYLGMLYGQYWGIDSAIRCAYEMGEVIECDEYLTQNKIEDHTLEKLMDKGMSELIALGHLVDPATKLRFLSLINNENLSQQEAYELVIEELNDLGYEPFNYLPDEAKTLADRARRYRDKRFEELAALSEN